MDELTSKTRVPLGEGELDKQPEESFFDFMSNIIQACVRHDGPVTLVLENLTKTNGKATIGFAHNRITHASIGNIAGESAFYEVMAWPSGRITEQLEHYAPINIHTSLTRLMLDAYWYLRSRRNETHDRQLDLSNRSLELTEESLALLTNKTPWYSLISSKIEALDDVLGHVVIGKRGEVFIDQGASIERARQMISAVPVGEHLVRVQILSDRRCHILLPVESKSAWLYLIMRGDEPLISRVLKNIEAILEGIQEK
ncbi:MAG: hypothetical protein VYE40_14940 [Myxococcota bacterium]|jgi:hypothetical protein|nr:hypothetical protein [Myxococcota bacterium]